MDFSGFVDRLKEEPIWVLFILLLLPLVIGLLSMAKWLVSFLRWIYVYFLRPPKNLDRYGSWAMVTGGTDGIGKAISFRLASEGLNLVLVGRNPSKLNQVSEEIKSSFDDVKIKTVVMDFSGDITEGMKCLEKTISEVDVGILVNNAGTTYPTAMYFHEVEEELWRRIVRVNLEGLTLVTQAVLPAMLRRRKGAIINVGSGAAAAIPAHPLFAIYAATKAYVDSFSRSLNVEYKKCGIDVHCHIPMYVATKMVPFKTTAFFIPSPDRYARAAVRQIGYEPRCTPYWTHSVQWWLASMVPEFVLSSWRLKFGLSRRVGGEELRSSKMRSTDNNKGC